MELTQAPPTEGAKSTCRIQVLPSDLANQIAAGEVVARPASAIKELCENSLDAGATSIEVEIDGGGIKRLMVLDDGSGMTREEALLALERHATSKIKNPEDLFRISTMGFRGEALPSIASVSRFFLTTRRQDDICGSLVEVEGGGRPRVRDAGCAVGTRVEVCDLFFNVPARRKFLKTEATERGHAMEAVTRLALARPDVSFRVRVDGRDAFSAPKTGTRKGRASQVFGHKVAEELYPFRESAYGITLEGLLGNPGLARTGTKGISIFVNHRYVTDRAIAQALASAYGGLLEKGKYPLAILWLEIDPEKVDVNVHPAKEEIRFTDPQRIFAAVRKAAIEGLRTTPWLGSEFYSLPRTKAPSVPNFAELPPKGVERHIAGTVLPVAGGAGAPPAPKATLPPRTSAPSGEAPSGAVSLRAGPSSPLSSPPEAPKEKKAEPLSFAPSAAKGESVMSARPAAPVVSPSKTEEFPFPLSLGVGGVSVSEAPSPAPSPQGQGSVAPSSAPLPEKSALQEAQEEAPPRSAFFRAMRPVGQIKATYLVLESQGGLVLIDQHAAHESVTFDRLRRGFFQKSIKQQRLLFPATVELSPAEAAACEAFSEELKAIGLEVEPFGPQTIAVISVPQAVAKSDPEALLRSALDELGKSQGVASLEEKIYPILATMACHGSVRAGQHLSGEEIRALLSSMDETDFGGHCPHGRPVYLELSWKDLERRFGRLG